MCVCVKLCVYKKREDPGKEREEREREENTC